MTRDRLIELIQASVNGCARYWAQLIADYLIANGVTVVDAKIATTTWRPASEPPKESGRYLVLHGKDKCHYQVVRNFTTNLKKIDKFDFAGCNRAGWYGYSGEYGFYEDTSVTHWMPLPKPPKEVDNGKID